MSKSSEPDGKEPSAKTETQSTLGSELSSTSNFPTDSSTEDKKLSKAKFNQEKKDGKGEDADPLLFTNENGTRVVLGVFDGMGGAGATEYTFANGEKHTGAYLASRFVANETLEFLKNQKADEEIDTSALQKHLSERLNEYAEKLGIQPSRLRGSTIRTLPTTFAMIEFNITKQLIYSYWCGDSRNYMLRQDGLRQISTDDLVSKQDPLENLRNDDALSNCISHDREFTINHIKWQLQSVPVILLSATDGCFGYLHTPMHFEMLLLQTLLESSSIEEWKAAIVTALRPISGDDFSMAIVMIGLPYEQWKTIMSNRYNLLKSTYIDPIEQARQKIVEAEHSLEELKINLDDTTTKLWQQYKSTYMNEMIQ